MFNTILNAAIERKPFTPDSFISISQASSSAPPTPIELFGDAKVFIDTQLARDITEFSNKYEQEKEGVIPPYETFRAEIKANSEGKPPNIQLVSLISPPIKRTSTLATRLPTPPL